jgi:ribonuclease HI
MILYTDGGCSNNQKDISFRKMISVVTNENGNIIIDKRVDGGSNNIAELIAVKEALLWCKNNNIKNVEIRTDSKNNLAWVMSGKVGKKLNDKNLVLSIISEINRIKSFVNFKMVWVPREKNQAGFFIEKLNLLKKI